MAGAGSVINYSNIVALDGTAWRTTVSLSGDTGQHIYYVSAPVFYVNFTIHGSGLWGYQAGSCYVYPYDSSTGAFSSSYVYGSWSEGRGDDYGNAWNFYHNIIFNGSSSSEDISNCHLWKIETNKGDNNGSANGTLYISGMGKLTESIYNSNFKNRKIYASKCDYYQKGNTYSSDEAFLQACGYSCMRGTKISVSSGSYKYLCAREA
jgi:hypothetical protein